MARATALNRFLESFVLPLVAGGRVEVRGLLGPGVVQEFVSDRTIDATLVNEVTKHMRAHLGKIGPVSPMELLPPDVIALAAVWHNLLAMTHPEVAPRVRLRRKVRAWTTGVLGWIGPARTATEVATRHAALARLTEVGRVDTDVTFWAGSARFIGVAPPKRLIAWKKLRRVRETHTRVGFYELLQVLHAEADDANLTDLALAALALSPLTDIATADRPAPVAFDWSCGSINALGDNALRGAAQRVVLGRGALIGAQADEVASARVKTIEHATLRAVAAAMPQAAAQVLVLFHIELLVGEALGRGGPPTQGHALAWDAVARLGAARASRIVGLEQPRFERALGLDLQTRGALKEAPAAPLLTRAGFLEVPS